MTRAEETRKLISRRYWAAMKVTWNWRIRQRLPRLTRLATTLGMITEEKRATCHNENSY